MFVGDRGNSSCVTLSHNSVDSCLKLPKAIEDAVGRDLKSERLSFRVLSMEGHSREGILSWPKIHAVVSRSFAHITTGSGTIAFHLA